MADISGEFKKALALYQKRSTSLKEAAGTCAELALTHFANHGDVHYLQKFADLMQETATMRRNAFIKWACGVAPIQMQAGKFSQDDSRGNHKDLLKKGKDPETGEVKTILAMALEVPFWEYAPEAAIRNYGADDVLKALNTLIKRFENADRSHLSKEASSVVVDLKKFAANRQQAKKAA